MSRLSYACFPWSYACMSFNMAILELTPRVFLLNHNTSSIDISTLEIYINKAISDWLFTVVLIPLYQLLLYRCFRSCSPGMLRCIGAGLFIGTLGYILLSTLGVYGIIVSDVQRYLSCTALTPNATNSDNLEWYWKLGPCILYGIGKTISAADLLFFLLSLLLLSHQTR